MPYAISTLRFLLRTSLTMFAVAVLGFFLMTLAPGDVVDYITAENGVADAATTEAMRQAYGLDQSIWQQLVTYLRNLASGSLGTSMRFSVPVADLIVERLPATLLLVFLAISLAGGVGLVVGTVMAMCAGGWRDRLLTGLTLIFYALPSFWLALMLMVVFSIWLGWLPTSGYQTLGRKLTGIDFLLDRLRYLILPVLALSSYYVALYARLTRSAVLEAKRQDYVRTAIAKGLSSAQVTRRHILRNALIPVTTLMGMHIGGALGGAVVIETIFAWPGMGRLTYEAILSRDYVLLLGILLSSVVIVIAANALIDVLHRLLDPRISPQS